MYSNMMDSNMMDSILTHHIASVFLMTFTIKGDTPNGRNKIEWIATEPFNYGDQLMALTTPLNSNKLFITPFDEGFEAAKTNLTKHNNPYKNPNIPKTDDVKSEAWIRGFDEFLYKKS